MGEITIDLDIILLAQKLEKAKYAKWSHENIIQLISQIYALL